MGGRGFQALTKAPHPNAAKYFGNWFLSREGQMFYQRITRDNSLRTDIPKDNVTPDDRIDPKAKNWYDWKKVIQREEARKFHRKLLKEIGGY
jgi:ABC-type Fe3+ transport system substrate-binding protein